MMQAISFLFWLQICMCWPHGEQGHLHTPKIKPASNECKCFCRLILCADVDSWLSPVCKQAFSLSHGDISHLTILLCLDDLSPSSKKETLALNSTQPQHEWYAICCIVGSTWLRGKHFISACLHGHICKFALVSLVIGSICTILQTCK